jgi:D-threo-aldose 1-dehydrogenase
MRLLPVANTGLRASRIAFGTASIHHLRGAPDRRRLLLAAADDGITHFDTSPYYGFGTAETSLAVLANRPQITVATKVGLYPPGGADAPTLAVVCRKVAGRLVPRLSRPLVDFSVAHARESLAGSLRRMRRERVDVLFLHEPHRDLIEADEWLRWIESAKDRIGAIGVAGEADRVLPFARAADSLATVIQTRDSLARREATPVRTAGREPQFTYGHLAHAASIGAEETLSRTIERWPETVLLVGTRHLHRLHELTRIARAAEANVRTSGVTS